MVIRRRALALVSLAFFLSSSVLSAQPKEATRKLNKDEQKDFTAISTMLGTANIPANDLGLTWLGSDLLKAQGNNQFVPFSVSVDTSKLSSKQVALFWRAVAKNAPAPDPAAKKDDKGPQYLFQYLQTVDVPSGQAGPTGISRSFVLPAGEYDVYVVAKEPDPKKKSDPPAKFGIVKQTLSVIDLWNGEFNTGSVIVAERLDPLPAPLTLAQIEERPYAAIVAGNEIVPARNPKFKKSGELTVFMPIYNAKVDAAGAPDVVAEYSFYISQNGSEKYFNKTQPQPFNAQTAGQGAAAAGLPGGTTIPLGSFPAGDYRLEIKVTDKLGSKSLTREAKFSVAGS